MVHTCNCLGTTHMKMICKFNLTFFNLKYQKLSMVWLSSFLTIDICKRVLIFSSRVNVTGFTRISHFDPLRSCNCSLYFPLKQGWARRLSLFLNILQTQHLGKCFRFLCSCDTLCVCSFIHLFHPYYMNGTAFNHISFTLLSMPPEDEGV